MSEEPPTKAGLMICQLCSRDCRTSIQEREFDFDETPDDTAVEVSTTADVGGRTSVLKGIMCADCMRRGKTIPIPSIVIAETLEDKRRSRMAELASKHATKRASLAFRMAEDAETPSDRELDALLGRRDHVSVREMGETFFADDDE